MTSSALIPMGRSWLMRGLAEDGKKSLDDIGHFAGHPPGLLASFAV
jgi:hypothetical protein